MFTRNAFATNLAVGTTVFAGAKTSEIASYPGATGDESLTTLGKNYLVRVSHISGF